VFASAERLPIKLSEDGYAEDRRLKAPPVEPPLRNDANPGCRKGGCGVHPRDQVCD
jgi:hypothetical protein